MVRSVGFRQATVNVQFVLTITHYATRETDQYGDTVSGTPTTYTVNAWRMDYDESTKYEELGYVQKTKMRFYIDNEIESQTYAISTGDTVSVSTISKKYRVNDVETARFGTKTFGTVVDLTEMQDV